MKTLFALIVAAFVATPALAAPNSNFTGPRIEVTAGVDDVSKIRDADINYGLGAGVDLPLGDRFTIGAEANVNNFADYKDFGGAARLGFAASDNVLLFGSAGYANFRGLDGPRIGGGIELKSSKLPFYTKVEYRYTDFEHGVGRHAGLVGFGLRF